MRTQSFSRFTLMLTNGKGTYLFEPAQIIRLMAKSNYTIIFPVDHKPFVVSKVLKVYEDVLVPYGFIRTHRSHMINAKYIRSVTNEAIVMQDASTAEISRRNKTRVMKQLKRW